jgi:anti-sigma factor ChrR (cupin superfamily)
MVEHGRHLLQRVPERDVDRVVVGRRKTMETQTLYTPEMTWEVNAGFPGGADAKVLRQEGERKAKTLLIRLSPGGRVTPHSHIGTVQHYLLQGEYEAEGKRHDVGTYRLFHPHADVSEISTKRGATILMIYDPVV